MRSEPFWRLTYFPGLAQRLRLNDLKIERSTYESFNSLFLKEIPDGLAALSHFSLDRLASHVGVKPLVDLLAAVHFYIDQSPMSRPDSERLNRNDIEVMIRKPETWHSYSHKHFPLLPKAARYEDLGLSVRADNCIRELIKSEVISDVWELSQLTVHQLMKQPNFGLKSLATLLDGISALVLEPIANEMGLASQSLAIEKSTIRLDATQRRPLSKEQIRALLAEPTIWQLFRDNHFPQIPSATKLADLNLGTRTYNCLSELINGGVISRPSDIAELTIGRMMSKTNFGTRSLVDLLRSLDHLACYSVSDSDSGVKANAHILEPLSSNLTMAADRLSASRTARRVRANDPRMRKLIQELLYLANNSGNESPLSSTATLSEIARRLVVRVRDPVSPSEAVSLINKIRLRLFELIRMSLEEELQSSAAQHIAGRNFNLILLLMGWNGGAPTTLESVGQVYGLTRERVRQIQAKFLKKWQRTRTFLPSLERVLRFLANRVPMLADDVERELCKLGLTARQFRAESIIATAKWMGMPTLLGVDQSTGARLLLTRSDDSGWARLIEVHTRRTVSKYGVATFVEINAELADKIGSFADLKILTAIISAMPSYEALGQGWFWLREGSRNHMLTIIRKVFAVAPRIHLSEMRAAIANDPRGMGFAPPKEVVARFCQSAVDCAVDDDFLVIRKPHTPESVLSDNELMLFNIFCTHGPLLRREDIERLCVERGMNRTTLGIYLTRLAIVARFSPSIYGLRGAIFSPSDLERLSVRRQDRYSDHGWTENAQPWAAVELSPSAITSGVVQLPTNFRQQMRGRYVLKTEDGLAVGQLVVSDQATWGLGPLFRRRGGEPGDILLLTFDLRQREVTARFGDLTVLPEPGSLAEEVVGE